MHIGIIGSGDVGQALGRGFAAKGHDVKLGTRDPKSEKVQAWATRAGVRASTGTFAEAAAFGELLVIATLWTGTESAITLAGPKNFAGKVVIDATNPLDFSKGRPPRLAVSGSDSAGEQIQRWLPAAKVVKAFNTVGNADMVDPQFPGGPPDLFICGNDPGAKQAVSDLCRGMGWPAALDVGGIESARYLEPMAMVWILYGAGAGSWKHAFKLLRK